MGQRELQFKRDGQRDRIIFEKKMLSHRFLKEQRESVLLISGD